MTTHMPIPGFPTLLPLVVIFSTFAFVLSVILINKSPKAGACLVAGLILAALILLLRGARGGLFSTPAGLPFAIIPGTFLFILVVIVLAKDPKAGAVLVVGLLGLGLFGTVFAMRVARQATAVVWEQTPTPQARVQPTPMPQPSAPPAPIWSAGVDKELDADVYPSKLAAVQALGSRLDKPVRELLGDVNEPPRIIIFQEELDRALTLELKNAIQQVLPQAACRVEAEQKNLNPREVGVTVHLADLDMQPAPWVESGKIRAASGTIELNVSMTTGSAALHGRFVEKPWIEDFATFASNRPQQAFIIARSTGTCTSESEARLQAMRDASQQVMHIVWNRGSRGGPPARDASWISSSDLQENGLVVDTFVQSFEGSVGKIWRQAVLLDVSGSKVTQLFRLKSGEVRRVRESWARMGLSGVGVILLIGVIYFFLNMATRGYYEWSLRIASMVLAVVGVLSILMVVK